MDDNSSLEGSDEDVPTVKHVVTAQQILLFGLRMFFKEKRINNRRTKQYTNIIRFKRKFGVHPITASTIYEDLQKTNIEGARIEKPNDGISCQKHSFRFIFNVFKRIAIFSFII